MSCPYPFYRIFFVEHGILWYGTAFWSSWSAVLAVSLPRVLSTPILWVFEGGIERKVWYCGRTAQQQPKHWCIIGSVPATSPEHRTSRAEVRRVNSSPHRPTTAPQRNQVEQRAARCLCSELVWGNLFLRFNPATTPVKVLRSAGSLLWHWRQRLLWILPWAGMCPQGSLGQYFLTVWKTLVS